MSNPSIIIDPNEARDIEKNLILREIYYRPTGYFSNAKTLRDEYHKLIREWVKYLPEVIDYLNNYPTRLIRAPGSSKWGLAPIKAIKLEKVESRPSTKYKRPVGKNEENKLKKGDSVRYLLANAEWEGGMENQKRATDPTFSPSIHKIRKIVVTKNEPVLYYLGSDDDEYPPKRGFVREELMHVNIDTLQYPPQSILEENTHSRSVNIVRVINKMTKAQQYVRKRGGHCIMKTDQINDFDASKPHHIKDKTICGIASLCPNLTYLYLGYSNNISDISVIEIAKSCKKIEYINIGGSGITDVSLKEIAHLCPNLRHLHLSNCEKITDDGICAIAISHPNMLSFSFADEEGKFDMDNIAVSDTSKLVIADCDEISMNAIITLQNKNPTLNIFGWYSDTNSESDTDGVIQVRIYDLSE
ncbi:3236_t:CDS:2 [Entrophospora sp. SA101]|nr:3236_t:CDS:2 [Entrophospora sp. SA101]